MLAERTNNSKVHLVERIQFLLKRKGIVVNWGDLIAAFRLLQEAECGTFVKGSKGYSSRFYWEVKSTQAAGHALNVVAEDEDEEDEDEDDENVENGLDALKIRHSFMLRLDLEIFLNLPASLTQTEANRLAQFAESLSFTDAYENDEDEADGYDDEEIQHSYVLRPTERVTLGLPADLTPREASRLADFIRVLSWTE